MLPGPLDARVRDQIIAETRRQPAGPARAAARPDRRPSWRAGSGCRGAAPLAGRIEDSFRRQIEALPAQTRRLLLLAAADPSGDAALVWRAAGRLGIPAEAARAARPAGWPSSAAGCGSGIRWSARRPTGRRRSETGSRRTRRWPRPPTRAADPDRRAWHRAQAAAGPDEEVAAELERSAGRAQARGGLAAAAAFLERAAALTPDPARGPSAPWPRRRPSSRPARSDAALTLLALAEAGPLDDLQRARADLLRGQIAFALSRGQRRAAAAAEGGPAARAARPAAWPARPTWTRCAAAMFAGRLAAPATWRGGPRPRGGPARAARHASPTCCSTAWRGVTDGYAAGVPSEAGAGRLPRPACLRAKSCAGCGWPAWPRRSCGTTRPGTRCPPGTLQLGPRRPGR